MDIKCQKCNKKNLITNLYCYNCAESLHPAKESLKLIKYNSTEEFFKTFPESSYYNRCLKKKEQKKIILRILLIISFFCAGSVSFFIIFLLKLLAVF
ncbi:MAG TPA: hypothetical protein PL110_01805 [Candidatus Eremiobacteraeota bacterium]|nr:MAG: hypothetical protein BWY64_03411 [bacterium ADurb.Bin363]HPZ06824.1 hypothetical protein [Candidatus Eremiobacteraeota bacterium]